MTIHYARHEADSHAVQTLIRLKTELTVLLTDGAISVDNQMQIEEVFGEGLALASDGSIPVFTCPDMTYPSRYLRIITSASRAKHERHIPLWAARGERFIALNPNADLQATFLLGKARTERACLAESLLNAHAWFGGYRAPKQKRVPRPFGLTRRREAYQSL